MSVSLPCESALSSEVERALDEEEVSVRRLLALELEDEDEQDEEDPPPDAELVSEAADVRRRRCSKTPSPRSYDTKQTISP